MLHAAGRLAAGVPRSEVESFLFWVVTDRMELDLTDFQKAAIGRAVPALS
ncbi:hypothetical protein [Chachezhania sediminis]|nr:hypothetical protein [Chachezhania sediminis]